MLTEEQARAMLIQARKRGATRDYAIIGKDDDATQNPFDSQQSPPTGTGELNTVYARINGNPDPQTVYYSPDQDMRIIAHGARVLIKWIDGQPWIDGADKVYLTQQQNGAPLPTHNFPLRIHDHTSDTEGGSLGADTVDTTQLVDDAVIPTKTDGLSGASTALVTQTASDTFSSILYNHTATSAPTTGDDTGDGYVVGSQWLDVTNDRSYQALDVTASNAVWRETSNPVYFFLKLDDTGNQTTSGTTELTVFTYTLTAAGFDPSKRYIVNLKTSVQGNTSGDVFRVAVKYNYDNLGSEAFIDFGDLQRLAVNSNSGLDYKLFTDIYDGASIATIWGYSGDYKVRVTLQRVAGTGTMTWNLTLTTLQVIEV